MLPRLRHIWQVLASDERAGAVTLGLFALATALRLAFNLWAHPLEKFVFSDMWVHNHRAENLLSGRLGPWDSFTPAGYPAMLAAIFALSGKSYAAVGVVQALLGGATAPLTRAIARLATGSGSVALASGLVAALYLPLVFYGGLLMTEVPFAFLLLAGTYLLLRGRALEPSGQAGGSRPRANARYALAGLALGLGAVVRPNLLVAAPFLLLWVLWAFRGERRRALAVLAIAAAAALPPVAAASVHSSRLVGRPVGIATNGGLNFFLAHAEVRGAHFKEGSFTHKIVPIPNLARYDQVFVSPVPLYEERFFYEKGVEALAEDPYRVLASLENLTEGFGLGHLAFWPGFRPVERILRIFSRSFFWIAILPAGLHFAALVWLRRLGRPEERGRLLLFSLVGSAFATTYAFLGDPRMRVPFDPLIATLAIDGVRRGRRAFAEARALAEARDARRDDEDSEGSEGGEGDEPSEAEDARKEIR